MKLSVVFGILEACRGLGLVLACLAASGSLTFGAHDAPADDFPVAELQYKDHARFYHLHSPYGFVAGWENGHGRFYLYDKARTNITVTGDLKNFIRNLSNLPEASEVAWVNTCSAPLHYGMPRADV